MKRIAVFGGSRTEPGERDYIQAMLLGKSLAESGFAVMTGGYIGSMEAVSRGAYEAGGFVIGVTCDEIENWRPVGPNPWIMKENRVPTIRQRLYILIEENDAAIALPGGVGTMTEILFMWNHLLIASIGSRPLILMGEGWKDTFMEFFKCFDNYIPSGQREWLTFVDDVDQAIDQLVREMQIDK